MERCQSTALEETLEVTVVSHHCCVQKEALLLWFA